MTYDFSERILQVENAFDDVDSIRVLLYLDEYNPNVLLEDLEKHLEIENKELRKIVTNLISAELVKKDSDTYRLSNFGKITVNNLKQL